MIYKLLISTKKKYKTADLQTADISLCNLHAYLYLMILLMAL